MTNKSWQRQHCLRIVQCLKTPIQNSCVRLFYPLSFKISKIPSQNVFCVFVTSSFLFLYCWYECHSNYSIGSWHKSLALTPTNRKWRSHLCILNICRLTYYLEYRKSFTYIIVDITGAFVYNVFHTSLMCHDFSNL